MRRDGSRVRRVIPAPTRYLSPSSLAIRSAKPSIASRMSFASRSNRFRPRQPGCRQASPMAVSGCFGGGASALPGSVGGASAAVDESGASWRSLSLGSSDDSRMITRTCAARHWCQAEGRSRVNVEPRPPDCLLLKEHENVAVQVADAELTTTIEGTVDVVDEFDALMFARLTG